MVLYLALEILLPVYSYEFFDFSILRVTLPHVVDPIYPGAWLHQG